MYHWFICEGLFVNTAAFTVEELRGLFGEQATASLSSDWVCVGVSTDTRTLQAGNLFVALRGENFDAHTLVVQAAQKGALAAIIEKSSQGDHFEGEIPSGFPLIRVENTLHALGALAHEHRCRFEIPIIAVAGAAGKTTTKDMTAHVLAREFGAEAVLKTEGNLNNQIGVPLTLLRLTENHTVAVVEIGTNEPGEIEILSNIVQPTHGVITNIGKEHLEKLLDLDGVEREETALFRFLEQTGGTALINVDDDRLRKQTSYLASHLTYSLERKADLTATVEMSPTAEPFLAFTYRLGTNRNAKWASAGVQLHAVGTAMAQNALAAAAVGCSLSMSIAAISAALTSFRPTASEAGYGRMVTQEWRGITIVNDCYNANPISMRAALEALRSMQPAQATNKRVAMLGDMRELGDASFEEHCALLQKLRSDASLAAVVLTGGEMAKAYQSLQTALTSKFTYCETKPQCAELLMKLLASGDVLLIKGSRGIQLETVLEALMNTKV